MEGLRLNPLILFWFWKDCGGLETVFFSRLLKDFAGLEAEFFDFRLVLEGRWKAWC